MGNYILRTDQLTKTYSGRHALDHVSVTLQQGRIYGLIGQNGAGKTTFMRLITGLAFPAEGSLELFGNQEAEERVRVGSMIEYPALIPYMTASENLDYHRTIRGIPGKTTRQELLKLVGLSDTGKKKVKDFSLGMKQRLGIAVALVGNPEFLILDEPINGLDPVGVAEVRNLILRLCEERQITILISSHNLPELYQLATDYIIIHQGKIIQSITLAELEESCKHHILLGCENPEKLVSVLEMQLNVSNYQVMPDKTVKLYEYLDDQETVARTLAGNGIAVTKFMVQGDTLESYFLSVIGGAADD